MSEGCVSCVAHYSSSQAFAKVEAISVSRSNAELPVIVCCSFIRGGQFFLIAPFWVRPFPRLCRNDQISVAHERKGNYMRKCATNMFGPGFPMIIYKFTLVVKNSCLFCRQIHTFPFPARHLPSSALHLRTFACNSQRKEPPDRHPGSSFDRNI